MDITPTIIQVLTEESPRTPVQIFRVLRERGVDVANKGVVNAYLYKNPTTFHRLDNDDGTPLWELTEGVKNTPYFDLSTITPLDEAREQWDRVIVFGNTRIADPASLINPLRQKGIKQFICLTGQLAGADVARFLENAGATEDELLVFPYGEPNGFAARDVLVGTHNEVRVSVPATGTGVCVVLPPGCARSENMAVHAALYLFEDHVGSDNVCRWSE